MDFESKVISREVSEILWETEKTVGTAESCTGGRIAEAIIAVPGASKYFKGGIISYVNEIKENLLGVDPQVLEEKTAVCEEVAIAMVKGACKTLNTDYAISATGIAGPSGGTKEIPVGTIWLACGSPDLQGAGRSWSRHQSCHSHKHGHGAVFELPEGGKCASPRP